MVFNTEEKWLGMNGLLTDENTEKYKDDIKELLSKSYKWDDDCEEFEEKHPDTYHKYKIRAEFEDECCDINYKTILYVEVWLPNDEDAEELADIIEGTVVGGLNNPCTTFRITYRNEIYIKADSKEEAESIFRNMSRSALEECSEFVEIVSNEKED